MGLLLPICVHVPGSGFRQNLPVVKFPVYLPVIILYYEYLVPVVQDCNYDRTNTVVYDLQVRTHFDISTALGLYSW
jgi:hypothetical protein